jgi:hypothetical protein
MRAMIKAKQRIHLRATGSMGGLGLLETALAVRTRWGISIEDVQGPWPSRWCRLAGCSGDQGESLDCANVAQKGGKWAAHSQVSMQQGHGMATTNR